MLKQFLALSLFLTIVSANIHITSPVDVSYGQIQAAGEGAGDPNILVPAKLGDIAPGQVLHLVITRTSGTTFFWDNMELTVPDGWKKTGAKEPSIFTYDIEVPKDAARGSYTLTFLASGDIQVLTPAKLDLTVGVRDDVYSFTVDSIYPVFIDQSNAVPFSIKSDSIAMDTVSLSIEGIPEDWAPTKNVVLSPNEERKMFFAVEPKTEGPYDITFKASSTLGGAGGSADSKMIVYPASLASKLEVLNEGFSIVAVILQPLYSLLSLIGSIF